MPNATFAGHPLHPQLIVAPAALLPFSLVMDVMHKQTGDPSYAKAAYYTMVGGFVGGLAAGAAGAADYTTIPSGDKVKNIASLHGILNIGLLGLTAMNLLLRRGRDRKPGVVPLLLSMVGTAGVVVSAWYGGHLVYEHGMRVKAAGGPSRVPEIKLPGDEKLKEALTTFQEKLTQ